VYEFSFWQQTLWGWGVRWDYRTPVQDPMADLPADRTEVVESVPVEWPTELAGLRVGFPNIGMDRPPSGGALAGIPAQLADPLRGTTTWTIWHPQFGVRAKVQVPIPRGGVFRVEGNPRIGGEWDRRCIIVDVDDECVYEFIQTRPAGSPLIDGTKWHAQNWAVWDFDGNRVDGNPLRGGSRDKSFHRTLFTGGRGPHRLAMSIHDYVGGDGTLSGGFPRAGDVIRLSTAKAAELLASASSPTVREAIMSMSRHGVELADRNMNRSAFLYGQVGAWPRELRSLSVPLSDFELVTS
jgi:hypothetical protein